VVKTCVRRWLKPSILPSAPQYGLDCAGSRLVTEEENEKHTNRPDGRFPWLELAIDFNANGNHASSANDPMRLCEQCSAATEMQRVSVHKEFYEACSLESAGRCLRCKSTEFRPILWRRTLFLPRNVAPDLSRSPHENNDSIHKFAEAITSDSTAVLLVAYISGGSFSAAGRRLSRRQYGRRANRPF